MDERVRAAAQGALRRLGSGSLSAAVQAVPGEAVRLDRLTLAQLSNLAYLQAEDPLVQQVVEAIRTGRAVHLDRPAVEAHLQLPSYPPRMQEQFARWFSRISGFGVHLTGDAGAVGPAPRAASPPPSRAETPTPPSPPAAAGAASPEREVLADILGAACPSDRPCLLEPGRGGCGGCGRCRTLGF